MYTVILVDNPYSLILVLLLNSCCKFLNNRYKLRNNFLEIIKWPFLKSLCKDCMVSISTCLRYYVNSFIHSEAFLLSKYSDKFRNNHRRMCIVNLNGSMLMKFVKVISSFLHLLNNKLCPVTYHEIFLVNTKKITILIRIIWIKE